jgi:hypothetical protein
MRRILLAMVVALIGMVTLSAAADATPRPTPSASFHFCLSYVEQLAGPPRVVWDCRPTPLVERALPPGWPEPPPFPLCDCPFAIELNLNVVLPASLASMVMSRIHEGFYYLGAAAVTSDPGQAAQWHNTAMNAFTTAAQMLGGRVLPAARAGFVDRSRNVFLPAPYPGPQLAADYLRNGMTLLQQWLVTQNPQLWDLVVPQLDNAYTAMAQYS